MTNAARDAGRDVVLVVADATDATADGVCAVLTERGRPYLRADTAEFPARLALDAQLDPGGADGPVWTGRLRRAGRPGEARDRDPGGLVEVELSRIVSVYLRRPRPFEVPAHLSTPERWHAATESRYGLGGVLASLPVPFVNAPSASADAAYKPRQLAELAACGLVVPPTLVTNSPAAVRAFAAAHGELICKALAATVLHVADTAHIAYTRRISGADLDAIGADGAGIDYAAHLFQPFVPSIYAVRLIVVGDRMFPVRIDAHDERTRVDWRTDYDQLSYQTATLPADVAAGVRAYMHRAGLVYGAWDFLVDDQGRHTALECNPEGNFAWLEAVAPVAITEAIAEFLTHPDRGPAAAGTRVAHAVPDRVGVGVGVGRRRMVS